MCTGFVKQLSSTLLILLQLFRCILLREGSRCAWLYQLSSSILILRNNNLYVSTKTHLVYK